jgi:RNA polymerase sigma factor (TIGR02999 family)
MTPCANRGHRLRARASAETTLSEDAPAAVVTEVTDLLRAWRDGDAARSGRLLELLYADLKRVARRQLLRERRGHTLQTTALVHEAYLRLVDQRRAEWRDRRHFFAVAATVMRRLLVDHARARLADKRAHQPVTLTAGGEVAADEPAFPILELDRALDKLAASFPRPARVVELRFFGGLDMGEIAEVLGVVERTAHRDWAFARAWLLKELSGETIAGAAVDRAPRAEP